MNEDSNCSNLINNDSIINNKEGNQQQLNKPSLIKFTQSSSSKYLDDDDEEDDYYENDKSYKEKENEDDYDGSTNEYLATGNTPKFMSTLTLDFMKKQGFKIEEVKPIKPISTTETVTNTTTTTTQIDYDDEEGYIDPPFDFAPKFGRGGIGFDDRLPYPFVRRKHKEETTEFSFRQSPHWIKTADKEFHILNSTDMNQYLVVGDDDELPPRDEFCPIEKIEELEDKKSTLSDLDRNTFVKARARSNPYEWIKGAIFQNRAAVKMANLDKLASLIEIKPNQEKFYFADVCAGPGGFTEYTLWRLVGKGISQELHQQQSKKRCKVKGWGFTLKGECDWKLEKFTEDSGLKIGENFVVDYGPANDGDILNEQNIRHFSQMVLRGTNQKGVNLFMADGGISTEGEELNQESILGHLILCQFLMMFEILSLGGNFVCKIFDTFTPFTVGLLYIIFKHFESFTIVKPFTSRPLNSERYVIAKNLLIFRPNIRNYLYQLNQRLNNGENIMRIIDIKDPDFINFIKMKSLEQCDSQIKAFQYFTKAIEDWEYRVCDQEHLKQQCLLEWGIPLDPRYNEKVNNKHHPYNQQQQQQQQRKPNKQTKNNNQYENNNNFNITTKNISDVITTTSSASVTTTSTSTTTNVNLTSTSSTTSPSRKGLTFSGHVNYVKSPSKQFVSSLDAITKHKMRPVVNKLPPPTDLNFDDLSDE